MMAKVNRDSVKISSHQRLVGKKGEVPKWSTEDFEGCETTP